MTSFAFIFGVFPLAVATGPGANGRIAIGTAVIGGMLTATILALFYIPLFYVLVRRGVRDGIVIIRERFRAAQRGAGMKRLVALIALLSTACTTLEPKLARPDPAIPASWPVGDATLEAVRSRLPAVTYRRSSRDGRLQTLIGEALVNNRDLMAAAANIAAAREQYHIQRAQQFPQFNATAGSRSAETAEAPVPGPTTDRERVRQWQRFERRRRLSATTRRDSASRASRSTCSAGCGR